MVHISILDYSDFVRHKIHKLIILRLFFSQKWLTSFNIYEIKLNI